MGLMWLLDVVFACTGMLVMHVRAGPIYAVVGTCQVSVEGRVLDVDKHGLLYGPRLTVHFFMHNVKLVGVQGMS